MKKTDSELIDKIINYWDTAGISSFDSSTSIKNQDIASVDNYVESKILSDLINDYCITTTFNNSDKKGLDIGAGLGRFSIILAQYLQTVHALEPADSLYQELTERCKNIKNIRIFNTSLESFDSSDTYDIAIVSGILYLYSDEMVCNFLNKLIMHMNSNGTIIIRDFIVQNERKTLKSAYIKNGYCYYRNTQYWEDIAKKYQLDCIEIFRSTLGHSTPLNKIIQITGLSKIFTTSFMKERSFKKIINERRLKKISFREDITTVFIILKKDFEQHASSNRMQLSL